MDVGSFVSCGEFNRSMMSVNLLSGNATDNRYFPSTAISKHSPFAIKSSIERVEFCCSLTASRNTDVIRFIACKFGIDVFACISRGFMAAFLVEAACAAQAYDRHAAMLS